MTARVQPSPGGAIVATTGGYDGAALSEALTKLGLCRGDVVFVHAGLDRLGPASDCPTPEQTYRLVLDSLRGVIGSEGTILVPTYTFSFCRREPFDPQSTPTLGGPWSPSTGFLEWFRQLPGVVRSRDPIHSVAALGPWATEVVAGVPPTCFGPGSVFGRLKAAGGKILMLGLPLEEATFRHHVEELAGVPFRFKKLFTGLIREDQQTYRAGWVYSVRILSDNGFPSGNRLEHDARGAGVCRAATVGEGEALLVEAPSYYDLTMTALSRDPWYTARGPAVDPVILEEARLGAARPEVNLPKNASLDQIIAALWRLPRHIVSDGYDVALRALATQVPMTVHEFPSGLECWSWIVPEKWTCREAYLETLDGRRLFSQADNPLHVVSYSLPFEGEVDRDILLQHLHVHPRLPHAIPFMFKYYERDWGLCCSRELRDSLSEPRYRVVIRTEFTYGTLKVGEVLVSGQTDDTIVLCAHLCHPGMVNDDLSGVVVGLDVMRQLLAGPVPRYSYRFLIVPETIGSIAYLSQHPELIPRMRGGLFLEMLGRDHPHALQHSFAGDSEVDRCFALALQRHDPAGWTAGFRKLVGNDERQFNAPGVRVPMLSLIRQLPPSHPETPYREYHSSEDTPELVPPGRLEESRDLVLQMLATLEQNVKPVNRYPGEIFCSRFGIHIDPYTHPEANRALFDVLFQIDGTRTVSEIAGACGVSFESVRTIVEELRRHNLVDF